MATLIEQFDVLRKHIETKEGKDLSKSFRRALARSEKADLKMNDYYSLTMDGMKPEEAEKESGLTK